MWRSSAAMVQGLLLNEWGQGPMVGACLCLDVVEDVLGDEVAVGVLQEVSGLVDRIPGGVGDELVPLLTPRPR